MTTSDQSSKSDVVALRPFVPASDFEKSLRFYTDLGFRPFRLGEKLAALEIGPFAFLLQGFFAEGFASNYMMHMLVNDLDAWWTHIASLDLSSRYGVRAPSPPKVEPWGLRVAYVVDPSGVLWHIAKEQTEVPVP
jgi:catechol 2,3-dioxygenase-like lactoylglutathione lyase family enzyme